MNFKVDELKRSSCHRDWIVKITEVTEDTVSYETVQYPWSDTKKPSNTTSKSNFNDLFRNYNGYDISCYGRPKPYKTVAERQAEMYEALANTPDIDPTQLAAQLALDAVMDQDNAI